MVLSNFADATDDQLASLARTGSAQAWEELVQRHYPPLVRFLTAQTGDPEDAADLAQETFLDAYRRLDRLDPDQPFMPWLYRIARYNFLPFWRRRWALRHTSLEALIEGDGDSPSAVRLPDDTASVDERDAIQRALDGLSPLRREALLLHELKGLTAREVATMLSISEHAAERRIGRAAAEFRRRYVTDANGGHR